MYHCNTTTKMSKVTCSYYCLKYNHSLCTSLQEVSRSLHLMVLSTISYAPHKRRGQGTPNPQHWQIEKEVTAYELVERHTTFEGNHRKNHYEWINFIWNTQDEKCWMKKGNNVASKRMPRNFMKLSSVFRYHNICSKVVFCFLHNGLSLNILRNMRYDYHNSLEK